MIYFILFLFKHLYIGGGKDLATVAEFGSKQKMQTSTSDDVIFVKETPPTVSSSTLTLPPLKSLPTTTATTSINKVYPVFRGVGTTKDGSVNNVSSTSSMNSKHLPIGGNASSGGSSIMIGNSTGISNDHINSSGSGTVGNKKLPAGLITKANTTGYDIIKPNISTMSNMTNFSNMSNLSSLSNMSNMANMSQGNFIYIYKLI